MMILLYALAVVYVAAGCLFWLWAAINSVRMIHHIPILGRLHLPPLSPWPKLSVVVPACNEADTLEAATHSLLAEDYPNLQIILVDDRSADGTGAIIDRLAAADPRIRPVHVTHLPEGWLGKVHALHQGVSQADGEWVLFTDADVHFEPGTLRRAVGFAQQQRLDHLTALPELWPSSFLVDSAISSFLRMFGYMTRPWQLGRPGSKVFLGIGAFNLVRRAAFERTEGFPWLRLEVGDDMGLGLLMKRAGLRGGAVNARGLVRLHWYRTVGQMARGTEKGFAAVKFSVARAVMAALILLGIDLAPYVSLLPMGVPGLQYVGVVTLLSFLAACLMGTAWLKRPRLAGLLSPVGATILAGIALRSAILGRRRGGIVWRSTLYTRETLLGGARVKIM